MWIKDNWLYADKYIINLDLVTDIRITGSNTLIYRGDKIIAKIDGTKLFEYLKGEIVKGVQID